MKRLLIAATIIKEFVPRYQKREGNRQHDRGNDRRDDRENHERLSPPCIGFFRIATKLKARFPGLSCKAWIG